MRRVMTPVINRRSHSPTCKRPTMASTSCAGCLALLVCVAGVVADTCYWQRCVPPLYSSKTAYDDVRGDLRDVPALTGCTARSAWVLSRHGNRNPSNSVTASMKQISSDLQQQIIASFEAGTSQLCAQDIEDLRQWTWNSTLETSASYLTGQGYEELYALARRVQRRWPELLANATGNQLYLRPTTEQRTQMSAIAFLHGIEDGTTINATIDSPRDVDEIIRAYATCDRYQAEVRGDDPPVDAQLSLYMSTAAYIAVQAAVQQRLGVSHVITREEVYALYELCRFDRTWRSGHRSPWCAVFSDDDLVILEYRDDLRHYYRNGYGSWMNAYLGRPAIKDLYENLSAAKEGSGFKLVAYFSHDTMLQMAFSALGLFKDDFTLVGDHMEPTRVWRTSKIAAFTTNIIAVLNECGTDDWRVQFLLNERELESVCPVGGCSWDQFEARFAQYMDAGLEFCDLRWTPPTTQPSAAAETQTIRYMSILSSLFTLGALARL